MNPDREAGRVTKTTIACGKNLLYLQFPGEKSPADCDAQKKSEHRPGTQGFN
jgi:hypothetical protein